MTESGVGLDTSVVVRLLTGQPEPLAYSAREFLQKMEIDGAPAFVSNLVVSEAYLACHHHYRIPKGEVLEGLRQLLSQPTFHVHEGLLDLLAHPGLDTARPGFLDRLIHAEYVQAGLPLVSFEKAAGKLSCSMVLHKRQDG